MKNLSLILGLMIAASPAFASRARLESLGEGKNGSYYINDGRNIFLNPAQLVKYKKKLMLELGGQGTSATNPVDVAPQATTRGEGGFTNTFGDYTYGLYLNHDNDQFLTQIAANAGFIAPESAVELFFAGEGAMNWGLSVFYAGNNTKAANLENTASNFGARVGIDSNNLQVFGKVDIIGKSNINNGAANGNELKEKVSFNAGVTYAMENWTWFGKFNSFGTDLNSATVTEYRATQYGIGGGYHHEMSKATTMYGRIEATMGKTGTSGVDTNNYNVPVVLAAESQALSWLAVRGSIAHSLLGQQWNETTRNSFAGSTTVAAGVGLTFGDVQIDGLVASTAGTANAFAGTSGFGTAPMASQSFGFGDNMISRIGLTYNF